MLNHIFLFFSHIHHDNPGEDAKHDIARQPNNGHGPAEQTLLPEQLFGSTELGAHLAVLPTCALMNGIHGVLIEQPPNLQRIVVVEVC